MQSSRIVHVIGALAAGGAERFVVDLVCDFRQREVNVELIVLSSRIDSTGEKMRQLLERNHVPVTVGPSLRLRVRTVLWFGRTMRRINPDIVHLHTTNTDLVHFMTRRIWGFSPAIVRTIHTAVLGAAWHERLALRQNRAFVTIGCGEAAASSCRSVLSGEIVTILNGVKFSWPIRTAALANQYKHRLGLDPSHVHYLSVGRMDAPFGGKADQSPKAHDVMVSAWMKGGLGANGCKLHMVGDGPLRDELQSLARNDSSVVFHGVRSDIPDWLLAADCFVMPSRWEGLPLAGIEAVGSGLPCVFSDIPELRELRPTAVQWVPVNDVEKLADSLLFFSKNPAYPIEDEIMGIRKRFNISDVATQYLKIYERIGLERTA